MEEKAFSSRERVQGVLASISEAAARARRDPSEVALMAVVKTRTPEEIAGIAEAGVTVFGENRVQEGEAHLRALEPSFREGHRIHFIGRLQANKARKALAAFDSIDGLDGDALALRLSTLAGQMGVTRDVMVEVNLGEESQKGGVSPEEAPAFARRVAGLPHLRLTGLMGVPPLVEDPEASRPYFRSLAKIFRDVRAILPDPDPFTNLSMGMSHDFHVAVEEGATLVRVGTALFGPRRAP